MKSLATTLLIFATCLIMAATIALIDQAEATLAVSNAATTSSQHTGRSDR